MKWISVEDRLPDDGGFYLCYASTQWPAEGSAIRLLWFFNKKKRWHTLGNATHWMPLPKPPESEDA